MHIRMLHLTIILTTPPTATRHFSFAMHAERGSLNMNLDDKTRI
jgi:hypothetical protein